jgi:EAL domain-containing protein (putative c-di-GMP-specific phosphodiesterase class I)
VAEIAEESGLAVPFGRAVIDRLERDTQQWLWESVRPRMLQLQLSYRHLLTDSTIVERLGALVDNGRTGGWSITVELPTVGVGQLGALGDELRELSRRGIYLSARGFTAISALSEAALPLEVMGIDEQFVGDVSTDRQRSAMLTSLLQFATTTGLHVTAAGAQSVTDLRALVAAGCRVSSGPVFGEPVAASELSRIMRRGFRHLTESVARPDRRAELPNRQTRGQDHGHHWILNELAYQFGAEATP